MGGVERLTPPTCPYIEPLKKKNVCLREKKQYSWQNRGKQGVLFVLMCYFAIFVTHKEGSNIILS